MDAGLLNNADLMALAERELVDLTHTGVTAPVNLRPGSAMQLLSICQFFLRVKQAAGTPTAQFAHKLADLITTQICTTPGLKELARRGWEEQYDERQDNGEAGEEAEPEEKETHRGRGPRETTVYVPKQTGKRSKK